MLGNIATGGTWTSSNTDVATVDAGGVVTGIALGTATISYTLSTGCATGKVVTVSAWPDNITGTKTVCEEATTNFICIAAGTGVWSSSDPAIAFADTVPGVIHGIAAGTATISYTISSTCVSVTTVTVNALPAPITGATSSCMGIPSLLNDVTPAGTWSSADLTTGTIDASGTLTGIAPGNVVITYTVPNGCARVAPVTIKPLPPVITGTTQICEGKSVTLASGSGAGTWGSSNNAIASAGPGTGIITGISPGTASVSFTAGATGCTRSTTVTVNASPAVITGTTAVCAGSTTTLASSTSGGIWAAAAATVNIDAATGIVTAISAGTSAITYSLADGCKATTTVNVFALPGSIMGTTSVCTGATAAYTDLQPGAHGAAAILQWQI